MKRYDRLAVITIRCKLRRQPDSVQVGRLELLRVREGGRAGLAAAGAGPGGRSLVLGRILVHGIQQLVKKSCDGVLLSGSWMCS